MRIRKIPHEPDMPVACPREQDLPEAETHVGRSNPGKENPYAECSSTNFRPSLKAAIFTSLNLAGTRDSMTESQVASS